MQEFDLAVVGSGPGGYRAAVLAALRGLNVAVVEKAQWGGCCLNRGCVPKKDWHHSALLIAESREFTKRGLQGALTADLNKAWEHQHSVVHLVRDSYVDYMKRLSITAIEGTASFQDAHILAVDDRPALRARQFILATGSSPHVPDIYPDAPGKILTTDDLFDHGPPRGPRVGLVGSGVIGTEFAFILTLLGKDVTWLTGSEPLSKLRFSAPARKLLMQALAAHGVQPITDCRPQSVEVGKDGVRLRMNGGVSKSVDWVLLGSGRRPHTAGLNLEAAGVALAERGFIQVNDFLQTSAPHIYAIGDVANPRMTANDALADAAVAVGNLLKPGSRRRDTLAVPDVVYSAVELGRLGLNEDEVEDQGLEPAVGFASFETNPRALGQDDALGFIRLIADMDDGRLLGAEVVGREAGELIHLVSQRYGDPAALQHFARTYYNHPSRAEELQNAAETLAAKWGLAEQVFGAG